MSNAITTLRQFLPADHLDEEKLKEAEAWCAEKIPLIISDMQERIDKDLSDLFFYGPKEVARRLNQ